jgi:photosystem II stability/assembly factor-like uncharacterized protein
VVHFPVLDCELNSGRLRRSNNRRIGNGYAASGIKTQGRVPMRCNPQILGISLAILLVGVRAHGGDLRHVEDATLRSVFFIDDKEGWIAGDEGVILHTIDGGKHWERQATGVRASIRSVCFLDPFKGWAVGREELPYGAGSAGVVLYTNDGGVEWKRQLRNALPGLNQVRFVDAKTGFFLGDGSDLHPSGVFKTTDAGRSWEAVPGPRTTSWLAGDFYDAKTGVLGGGSSRLGTCRNDKTTLTPFADELSGRDVTSLQILGKKTLAVAQGGLILTSVSGGSAWDFAKTKLPTEVLANLDFHCLHAVKDQVWVVGRPGSVVLNSKDAGTTWSLIKTGHSLPLHGVFFFDERLGWAVGDAGTILASTDGGKTWTTQHQSGQRAAAMFIHAQNKDVPFDTIALLGAAEGYLTTTLRVTAPDAATVAWSRAEDARRYAASMRSAGALTGETLWPFPLPQYLETSDKKTILAHWNKLHASGAEEELIRQLVLALRIWRPSVVISESPDSKTPMTALLSEAVQEAVRRAADAKAFPEQIGELGLATWKVVRVFGSCEPKAGALVILGGETMASLQSSPSEGASAAHGLLNDQYAPLPEQGSYQILLPRADTSPGLLEGLDQKVGESRRAIKYDEATYEQQVKALQKRRGVIASSQDLGDSATALTRISAALDELPDEHAANAAFMIASQLANRGEWYLAQEIYLYLVDRFPADPLSAPAYRWLVRLNTSGEARRRHELKQFTAAPPLVLDPKRTGAKTLRVSNDDAKKGLDLLTSRPETRDWNKGSAELMKRLSPFGPLYAFDPATQFCVQAARRQLGQAATAQDWMGKFGAYTASGPWSDAAAAELWLADRSKPVPRRLGHVRYSEVRPFLDGKLDDPCWQNFKAMRLDNAVGDSAKDHTTEAMFAHDQEFLYIALKCTHPAGKQVAPVKPRLRDADVDQYDRVSLLLDLDRDYATYYHLEIDQRGCVRDSCWGDRRWNPKWYVAVHSTEDCWQIEAAIPLAELTSERIMPQTAWAFNLVRIVPGRGVQSFSQPADVQPRPEGMSLLLFQSGAARPMPKAP